MTFRHRVAFWLLAGLTWLAAGWGVYGLQSIRDGRAAMRASDAAFNRGELREALIYARRAALSYVPGQGYVHRARARIRAIAAGAEATGREGVARLAWETLRGVELELGMPGSDAAALSEADRHLVTLEHAEGHFSAQGARRLTERDFPAQLAAPTFPGPVASAMVAGFLALGLASVASLRLAVERGLRIGQPWLWISALFGLMGVTSWAIALRIGG